MFTNKDIIFFSVLTIFKDIIESNIKRSLEYNINLTTDIAAGNDFKINIENKKTKKKFVKDIIILGLYDVKPTTFLWFDTARILIHEFLIKNYKDVFGTTTTLDKLFTPTVNIDYDYHYVIPYLINVFRPDYNLVRFETPDKLQIFYALINLGYENKFTDQYIAFTYYRKCQDENRKLSRSSRPTKLNSIKVDEKILKNINRPTKSKKSSKK